MPGALADTVPYAVGLAAAPMAVAAVILLLMAEGGRAKALAFAATWFASAALAAAAVALLAGAGGAGAEGGPPAWVGWLQLLIGAGLLLLGLRSLRAHLLRPPGAGSEPPAWLTAVDSFTPARTVGAAAALVCVNPKNLAMLLGAGAALGSAGADPGATALGALAFALLGSLGLLVPIAAAAAAGRRGAEALRRARAWLIANNDATTVTLLLVFGAVFAAKGARVLLS
ncbi:GAP family protein [Nocardiopsis sp. CNT-189]|uniref:GAP family protein n=1 Tax=Nocardiopsis oceanisediminis TaxID=2816862 RepID=UPI003B307EA0